MTYDPEDPRLTAFALGELDGDERAAVETIVKENDEARRVVEEIRALASLLSDQFKTETAPLLLPEQREAIEIKAKTPVIATMPTWSRWVRYGVAAGALTFVGGAGYIVWQMQNRAHEAAGVALDASRPAVTTAESLRGIVALNDEAAAPAFDVPADRMMRRRASGEREVLEERSVEAARAVMDAESAPAPRDHMLGRKPSDPALYSLAPAPATAPTPAPPGAAAPPEALAAGVEAKLGENFVPNNYAFTPDSNATLALKKAEGLGMPPGQPQSGNGPAGSAGGGMGGMAGMRGTMLSSRAGAAGGGKDAGVDARYRESDGAVTNGQPDANVFYEQQGQNRPAAADMPALAGAEIDAKAKAEPRSQTRAVRAELGDQVALQGAPAQKPGEVDALTELGQVKRLEEGEKRDDQYAKEAAGRSLESKAQGADKGEGEGFAQHIEERLSKVEVFRRKLNVAQQQAGNTEQYAAINENAPTAVTPNNTLSTFAVDVDTASYANMRRFLMQDNTLPPRDAVRIEELVNYFHYDYPEPSGDAPFSVDTEVTRCPWNADHNLLRIGLKGRSVTFADRRPANLVLVVDASGSMDEPLKMPLVKAGLRMLVEELGENDKISIITYAGQAAVTMPPTVAHRKPEILATIDALQASGSTNGAAGIDTAYQLAKQNFVEGGLNRVILCTDGDFNVGTTDLGSLTRMAEENAKTGVFLNVLGFGSGNLKDQTMEQIADKGNGQYGYIDSLLEARKNFVEQIGGTLITIAKDVKIQVDFNPAKVGAYRQIGYENRAMAAADFRNDAKDAGEIGSGHAVTALYEIIPPGPEAAKLAANLPASDFVKPAEITDAAKDSDKLATVRLRHKKPDGEVATEFDQAVKTDVKDLGQATSDTKFAASVALFGMLLRGSQYAGSGSLEAALELADSSRGRDQGGYRAEFIELIKKAQSIIAQP